MISTIKNGLQNVGKGWYNTNIDDIEVYLSSKLYKLMKRVSFMMEDTLRSLTLTTLSKFVTMIENLTNVPITINGTRISYENIRVPMKPLFYCDLMFVNGKLQFSLQEEKFHNTLLAIFDKFMTLGEGIPVIERHVLTKLFWTSYPNLPSPHPQEKEIQELREKLKDTIHRAFENLNKYSAQYNKYLDRLNLNVQQYTKQYESEGHSLDEYEASIVKHIKDWEQIDKETPSNVKLGLFHINNEAIRSTLKKDLAKTLLESLSKGATVIIQGVFTRCNAIQQKLREKCTNVEESTRMRDYIATIPEALHVENENLHEASRYYEVLEKFKFEIPNDEFKMRWNAVQLPTKVTEALETTVKNIENDEANFLKSLINDQEVFRDRLSSLADSVASFSRHYDISKIANIIEDGNKINDELKDCQAISLVINSRERLFSMEVTRYEDLAQFNKDYTPYRAFWLAAADWLKFKNSWMQDPLLTLNAEEVEKSLMNCWRTVFKAVKSFKQNVELTNTISNLKDDIESFKQYLPLIQALCNPGIRERHWRQLSEELAMSLSAEMSLTLAEAIDIGLMSKIAIITKTCDVASKEYAIESALDNMVRDWKEIQLEIISYKDKGTYILKLSEDLIRQLDDHIVMTQSMSFSPFKKVFAERIATWESTLKNVQEVLDAWTTCQRAWLYLEPIFSSEDITAQLPVESKRFMNVDRSWRRIMSTAKSNTLAIEFCADPKLLETFKECNKLLEIVSKGLSAYLETKRIGFPRFFFLSDDELLQILSQTQDPTAVQPHLKKCFENVASLEFKPDKQIVAMFSGEGEKVQLSEPFYPQGPVEEWLRTVETNMKKSVKQIVLNGINSYTQKPRKEWVLDHAGQAVIAVSQMFWTQEVSEALKKGKGGVADLCEKLRVQLLELVELVRGDLDFIRRLILGDLIVIDVHASEVVKKLRDLGVSSENDFDWISQLRYYWEADDLHVRIVNAHFKYGYEYLGNTGRLVITPLTDRCYLTLTGAMHLGMGGGTFFTQFFFLSDMNSSRWSCRYW